MQGSLDVINYVLINQATWGEFWIRVPRKSSSKQELISYIVLRSLALNTDIDVGVAIISKQRVEQWAILNVTQDCAGHQTLFYLLGSVHYLLKAWTHNEKTKACLDSESWWRNIQLHTVGNENELLAGDNWRQIELIIQLWCRKLLLQ